MVIGLGSSLSKNEQTKSRYNIFQSHSIRKVKKSREKVKKYPREDQ